MRSLFAVSVALGLSVACGSSSTVGPSDAGDASTVLGAEAQAKKFCDDVTPTFCDALFSCCTDKATTDRFGGSAAACKTQFASTCAKDFGAALQAHVTAGDTALDPTRLAACVSRLQSMKAGGAACVRPPQFMLFDCVAAFRGKLAPGAACSAADLPDNEFVPCKDGVCSKGKCVAFLTAGATCDPQNNNTAAAGCNYADGFTCGGTCVPRGALGATCDVASSGFSCDSMACVSGKCELPNADLACKGG